MQNYLEIIPIILLSREELEHIKKLQVVKREDGYAAFSVNLAGKIWPQVSWGLTEEMQRIYLWEPPKLLKAIADELLRIRRGGRFFINDEGAFYKDDYGDYGEPVPFIRFEITG